MKTNLIISCLLLIVLGTQNIKAQGSTNKDLQLDFVETSIPFNKKEKDLIQNEIEKAEKNIRQVFPNLPKKIKVILQIMSRNIDAVGGTTGRAQKGEPYGEVYVYISNVYPGGVSGAVRASLSYTIHHEFHHLARGWTMKGNKFDRGIDIAMVNEGLAVVFGELYSKQIHEGNGIPKEVEKWISEVLDLPKDANYNSWMNQHPDGRMGIGYRAGNHLIRKALKNSDLSIVELSKLDPKTILSLSGY